MLKAVLASGGDRSKKDRSGNTPRDVAKVMGRTKLVPLL
jgi:hypothetical protein